MKDIVKFIHELEMLKLMKRTGYWVHAVKDPDSIADHSFRAIVIGYLLAKIEKADENKVVKMLMFHDIPESRISDMHKIVSKYIDRKSAEKKVVIDQSKRLPDDIKEEYVSLSEEYESRTSKEAVIARDADLLELAFQTKEFSVSGNKSILDIFERTGDVIKTETGRKMYKALKEEKEHWWQGLKKDKDEAYWD